MRKYLMLSLVVARRRKSALVFIGRSVGGWKKQQGRERVYLVALLLYVIAL